MLLRKIIVLFHYINMLTYRVVYKHCYMFNAEWNILYYVYYIIDYTIILSMD